MLEILQILLYISVFAITYCIIKSVKQKQLYMYIKKKIIFENNKHTEELKNTIISQNGKKRFFNKLQLLLIKTGIKDNTKLWWITPTTVIIFCVVLFIVSYLLFISVLKLPILTFLFCFPIACIPIIILLVLSDIYEKNIEENLISFIIQLKNQAQINNDVVTCLKNTVDFVKKPLKTYIRTFLFELEQGINISIAFNELKEKVNLDRFKQLINNIESCYINGGNLYGLLEKTQIVFLKLQNERNKRNEETLSARIVLIILICISIFIYFRFINFNQANFDIMVNNFVGQVILVLNFISIWIMMFLIVYVKKFDK